MLNYVYIEITNCCQFNCSFCPKTTRPKKFLTREEFSLILDRVKPLCNNIYLHVLGEPLLHPALDELLTIAKEKDFNVHITTNAALIKDKEEILLKYDNIRKMNFSLHSAQDTNHIHLDIDKYLDNIFNFVDQMINNGTTCIYRLWDTNLSKNIILDRLNSHYNIDIMNTKSSLGGKKIKDRIFLSQDDLFEWPVTNLNNETVTEGKCLGLKTHVAIHSNGNVVPCCLDSEGHIVLGNIFKDDLKTILNSPLALQIKKGFQDNKCVHSFCKTCTYKNRFQK